MAVIYDVEDLVQLQQLDIERCSNDLAHFKADLVNVSRYLHRPLWSHIKYDRIWQ
jgi:hypothetical protein